MTETALSTSIVGQWRNGRVDWHEVLELDVHDELDIAADFTCVIDRFHTLGINQATE